MNINKWQSNISKLIKADLNNISLKEIKEATIYCLNSGKRLRPMLLLSMQNLSDEKNSIQLAANELALFVEYVHNSSLIVDDMPCMDNDDIRRGKPTLHKKYGESMAQLVSYNLLISAQNHLRKGLELIYNPDIDTTNIKRNRTLVSKIGDIVMEVLSVDGICGGQYLDLTINEDIDDIPPREQKEEVLRIANMKTGLLFSLSFILGWACKQGTNTQIEEIYEIKDAGTSFGLAYQIVDDLKDIEKDKQRNDGRCNICRYYKRNELIDLFSNELDNFTNIMSKYCFPKIFADLHNFLISSFKKAISNMK